MLRPRDLSYLLRIASGLILVLYFVLRSVPETLLGDIYVGPLPLHFFVFCIGFCFELLYIATSRVELLMSKPVIAILLIYIFALINGVEQENSLKFIAIDSICISGMLYGVLLAKSRLIAAVINLMQHRTLNMIFAIGMISIVGIHIGLIPPARDSTRLYSYSDFDNMFMLSALSPVACLVSIGAQRDKRYYTYYIARFAPVMLAAAMAWSTASRSGLVCCIISGTAVFTLLFTVK